MAWHDGPKQRDHPDVTAYIADLSEPQKSICQAVRDRMAAEQDVQEFIAWGVPCYWRQGPLMYTSAAKTHVTVGFFRGMEIGMGLVGTGKSPVAKAVVRGSLPDEFEAWVMRAFEVDGVGD